MIFNKKYTPRWIVFLIDTFICAVSITLAYMLRFNFKISDPYIASLHFIIPFVVSIRVLGFIIAKTYSGIVRYTGLRDAQRIFITTLTGSLFVIVSNFISYRFITGSFLVPVSIVIIDFMATVFLMTSLRWLVKAIFYEYRTSSMQIKKVVVYGSGPAGMAAKQTFEQDVESRYKIIGFVDNVTKRSIKKLEGIAIHPESEFEQLLTQQGIDYLILAKPFESVDEKREIIEICLGKNIRVLSVPSVDSWINGELSAKQIRRVKIEDLLERSPITLDINRIQEQVKDKVVLVTGAAGSIGSEMVRQIINFQPKNIILFDQAETPLYDIEMLLREEYNCFNFQIVIGDVADKYRVEKVFAKFKPDIVYHAAAYKHVPMMENNPIEAIKTNVLGTRIVADMANKYNSSSFVMVSTDKAVNPTNVMGASKRIAEIYCQSLNNKSKTSYITTRFGNVLGSNGSVIPRFRKQIEEGGPVTVTHPQITRYFMTIPEACQLVLEAGAMGKGGEIFIFDMGNSVKIVDLAKKMIKLSGLQLGKDIQISFTGLRPGEKLYEELLADKENTQPTHHDQIMIAKVRNYEYKDVSIHIEELIKLVDNQKNIEIVEHMKSIVPEFLSQNSVYEKLDKPAV